MTPKRITHTGWHGATTSDPANGTVATKAWRETTWERRGKAWVATKAVQRNLIGYDLSGPGYTPILGNPFTVFDLNAD